MIVAKFGSSSLNCQAHFQNIRKLVKNQDYQVLVVSALGKGDNPLKITDLLIQLYQNRKNPSIASLLVENIINRHQEIIRELERTGSNIDVQDVLNFLQKKYQDLDYQTLLSLGEQISARIVATYLGYTFVDAAEVIQFTDAEVVDLEQTQQRIKAAYQQYQRIVIPGFYGNLGGKVQLFSRGGSDITAALVAHVLDARVYENWKDVEGVYGNQNDFANKQNVLTHVSYDSLKYIVETDYQIIHKDAIEYVRGKNIPICVRNINTLNKGTYVTGGTGYEF